MNIKNLFEKINLPKYASIDLETTGLDHEKNRITEIGIAIVENGEITTKHQWLVNPLQKIPLNIERLTGINQQMVDSEPTFDEVSDELLKIIKDIPLVGQNIIFDINFLEASFRRKHKNFRAWQKRYKEYYYITNIYYDTAYLTRLMFPFFPKFSLSSIAEQFKFVPDVAHRALNDAITAAKIFNIIITKIDKLSKNEINNLSLLFKKNKSPLTKIFEKILKEKIVNSFIDEEYDWSHASNEQSNLIGNIKFFNNELDENSYTNPLDKKEVVSLFQPKGLLEKKLTNFECRDEQIQMADKVIDAFNNGQIISIEAGTGTGKSLAYLIPSIYWAIKNKERNARIIISTNTKNLQEQLFYKDLPFIKAATGLEFSAALLKGKSNYLCLDRWENLINNPNSRLSEHEKMQAGSLIHWKTLTQTGDINSHNGFPLYKNLNLWMNFVAEDKYCPGKKCSLYKQCFLMNIRNSAKSADIVVVNHALLCSDIAADNSILGPYDFLIVDEAHNLEKTAIEYLGYESIFWEAKNILDSLFESNKKLGLLIQIENNVKFADKLDMDKKELILSNILSLKTDSQSVLTEVRKFFIKINTFAQTLYNIHQNSDTNGAAFSKRIKHDDELNHFLIKNYDETRKVLSEYLIKLINLKEYFSNIADNLLAKRSQIMQDLTAKINRLQNFIQNLDFITSVEFTDYVYWFETSTNNKEYDIRLFAVPLNISEILYKKLFNKLEAGILTSATITVDNKFNYFNDKLGLNYLEDDRLKSFLLNSPFDYKKQSLIVAASHLMEPNNSEHLKQIKALCEKYIPQMAKGTLLLFTSYYLLKEVYNHVQELFASKGILALAQGLSGSRLNIINQFIEEHNSVLFGTNSFWEGVDVPGKSLEFLVITKLPFEVPTDPIVEARFELLKEQGKNPFMEYMLPEAIIKLKQGMGRLIRSKNDMGVILIADPRIVTKSYSKLIRNSLPIEINTFNDDENMFSYIKSWFEKKETLL